MLDHRAFAARKSAAAAFLAEAAELAASAGVEAEGDFSVS